MARTAVLPSRSAPHGTRLALTTPVVRAEGVRTIVVLQGEADLSTRPALADVMSRVIAWRSGDVVIDLAEAAFIDTATVRALAMGQRLLDQRGRQLTFRSPSRLAARVLQLFDLTALIEVQQPRASAAPASFMTSVFG
jgi:anti-anti-sigma factor